MKPPGVPEKWEDCNVITQADLIAYSQIRDREEARFQSEMIKVLGMSRGI